MRAAYRYGYTARLIKIKRNELNKISPPMNAQLEDGAFYIVIKGQSEEWNIINPFIHTPEIVEVGELLKRTKQLIAYIPKARECNIKCVSYR